MTETILQDALYTSSNAVHYPLNGSYMPSAMWTLLLHLRVDVFPESTAEVKSGLPSTHAWIWCITTGPSTLLCYCGYSVIAYYVWLHLTGIFFYRNYSRRGQDLWRRNCACFLQGRCLLLPNQQRQSTEAVCRPMMSCKCHIFSSASLYQHKKMKQQTLTFNRVGMNSLSLVLGKWHKRCKSGMAWQCVYCMKETWNTTIKSTSATLTMKKP